MMRYPSAVWGIAASGFDGGERSHWRLEQAGDGGQGDADAQETRPMIADSLLKPWPRSWCLAVGIEQPPLRFDPASPG
jgi:hypothetical protein